MNINIEELNDKKLFLAERARRNYARRKAEGRQNIKHIPLEEQKKPGRPKGTAIPKKEPKQRGRPISIINNYSNIPEYLINLDIDEPKNIFMDCPDIDKYYCLDSSIETDSQEIRNILYKLTDMLLGITNFYDVGDYENGDIVIKKGTRIIYYRMFFNNGSFIIRFNMDTKKYKILSNNMNMTKYNKYQFKKILLELEKETINNYKLSPEPEQTPETADNII